jgi:uncharacterized membrane protein
VSQTEPAIIDYLATQQESLSFLTGAEASHMADVAQLLERFFVGSFVALALLVLYAQYGGVDRALVRDACIMSLVFIVLLIPFRYSFAWFHGAFFPQGNWQFPVDSWLITHFPPEFFALVAACWFVGTAVLLGLSARLLPKT